MIQRPSFETIQHIKKNVINKKKYCKKNKNTIKKYTFFYTYITLKYCLIIIYIEKKITPNEIKNYKKKSQNAPFKDFI